MNVPETIAARRGNFAVVGLVFAAAAVFIFGPQFGCGDAGSGDPDSGSSWYTVDDGKTWFRAESTKLSPFDHEGKRAYRCYVFTCDGGRTKFVSHLERLPPDVLKKLTSGGFDPMANTGVEVKDPGTGDTGWVRAADPKAADIMTPRCPTDPGKLGEPVYP